MASIIIPDNFLNKLDNGSFVHTLLKNVSKLIEKAQYFPEYTLHNEEHINAVLELANQLIPDTIREKLSSKAIEILIGAIALHDLGMFIHRAGLKRLIFGVHKDRCINYLDKNSWDNAWHEFYNKVQRYTDRQLVNLFGDSTAVEKLPKDDVPIEDTKYQRLLYGEFIRRNHHRLAFDIAQIGFPGDDIDIDLFNNCNCGEDTKVMIGIVARSHGMKLRDLEDYLKNNTQILPDNIFPIIYLMAVLRIADSLHIGNSRASKLLELTDEMHSPESKRQFHLNQIIVNEPIIDIKRKLAYISANPDCSTIFCEIESIIFNIQKELDLCWAVLAEKYSSEYELSIHRISSNLIDENKKIEFNKIFLTNIVTLGANPDIAKLLIEPLYGSNPSFGVRELIQNAVDSCNERTIIDGTSGKITVSVDTNKEILTIKDNGIGMNEDVLKNYYLIAGSSFRCSDVWREKYTDDEGKAKFARSGRFGIGALASFLIGDEITVTTRHINEAFGLNVNFTIEPKNLDVRKIEAEIGTIIEIKLNSITRKYFLGIAECERYISLDDIGYMRIPDWYQWFHFNYPEIKYFYNGKQIEIKQYFIPEQDMDCNGWFKVNSKIFSNIKIGFERKDYLNNVFVNGIIISSSRNLFGNLGINKYGFYIDIPSISIIDKNNVLKLNLKRNSIFDFPELLLLVEEIYKYYLAKLLTLSINEKEKFMNNKFYEVEYAVWKNGYSLCSPSFVYHSKQKKIILLYYENMKLDNTIKYIDTPVAILDYCYESMGRRINNINLLSDENTSKDFYSYWYKEYYFDDMNDWVLNEEKGETHDLGNDCYHVSKLGEIAKEPPLNFKLSDNLPLIIEYTPENPCKSEEENIMLKLLREYIPNEINDGWIPFNIEDRKKMYPKAFVELERYMKVEDK